MQSYPYIAIEGAIGVGKTTLARILGEALPAAILLEEFEENPFLSDFYADRTRYAFQTQIFFLLSRYRQQHGVIAQALTRGPLISDYLFAKDWLFAHLNLAGDELEMYRRVHAALGERIPTPDVVVYLRATTDTLMQRILHRDRAYERQMSRAYIDDLRQAYAAFFEEYTASPVIILDTDGLDIVDDREARASAVARVRAFLSNASYQPRLLQLSADDPPPSVVARPARLPSAATGSFADGQRRVDADALVDFVHLTGEIGRVGDYLSAAWAAGQGAGAPAPDAERSAAPPEFDERNKLAEALAGALDRLLRIAAGAGVGLEIHPQLRDADGVEDTARQTP